MTLAVSVLRRAAAAIRGLMPDRARDPLVRGQHYNGSETPDPSPPRRYARGTSAVPAPPPAAF